MAFQNRTGRVFSGLSTLDKFLPIWIFLAMFAGVAIGYVFPGTGSFVNSLQIDSVSLPIAVGLIWMMYPPLAAVDYSRIGKVTRSKKVIGMSLILNWVVGPFLMFALAWVFLPDMPLLRDGVILIGLARCIAMVLVWNMLAGGDGEYAAVAVALNAAFQIALYSAYAYFFITVLPGWISPGSTQTISSIGPLMIARSVAVFLGIPLFMGVLTRYSLRNRKKEQNWYEDTFLKKLKPTALLGLIFTLVIMFSLQGSYFIRLPMDVVRVAIPLLAYFLLMFLLSFALSSKLGFSYKETATTSFTAASNNFELAIAVAVSVFGLGSSEAFATAVGPLIEVPVMVLLVYLSLELGKRYFTAKPGATGTNIERDRMREVQ